MVTVMPVHYISKILSPFIKLLSVSTKAVLRLLRLKTEDQEEAVTEEEIKALIKDPEKLESQAFQAIGYKEILPWMRGEMSREEAIETLSRQTRRYAKRQYSLFRSRPDFIPINESDPNLALIEILEDFKAYAAE